MKNMIKDLRDLQGLTQEDLAKKAKTSYQQIYKLESGIRKLSPDWVYRLCKALNCRPHQLIPQFLDLYTPRQRELLAELDDLDRREWGILKKIKDEREKRTSDNAQ